MKKVYLFQAITHMKTRKNIVRMNVLMGIALIGILALQFFWIWNAIKLEEQKYNRQLSQSLNNIAKHFQTNQGLRHFEFDQKTTVDNIHREVLQAQFSITDSLIDIETRITDSLIGIESKFFKTDTSLFPKNKMIIRYEQGEHNTMFPIKRDTINHTFPGEMEMVIIQNDSLLPGEAMKNLELLDPLNAYGFSDSLSNLITAILVDFTSAETNIEDRLKNVDIEQIVNLEMRRNDLSDDVQYYIHENNKLIWSSGDNLPEIDRDKDQGILLFPYSRNSKDAFIRFSPPSKFKILTKRIWWMLALSLLFSMAIIFTYRKALGLYRKQLHLNKQKNDFINNLGHEFKTPIATIRLSAETLSHKSVQKDPEKINPLSGHIIDESKRLQSYVERILSSAQLESRSFTDLHYSKLDIKGIIEDSIKQLKPIIDQKDVTIQIHKNREDYPYIGDAMLLTGVFRNILENSLKYSDEQVSIDIQISRDNTRTTVRIKDNGFGMDQATQNQIFDKFFRLTNGDLHDIKGLGLGMYFVKQVLDSHEAEIELESEKGIGSTFTIHLYEKA